MKYFTLSIALITFVNSLCKWNEEYTLEMKFLTFSMKQKLRINYFMNLNLKILKKLFNSDCESRPSSIDMEIQLILCLQKLLRYL